ncbi:MAG: hypothetical protein SFT92_02120 [Rickettsiales bacterium]|nr:hypothetical protein [Rickettsiales bacterium]
MSQEVISEWVAKAKHAEKNPAPAVKRQAPKAPPSKGNIIMELAERLRPWIAKMFDGQHSNEGMLIQPAHIRAISLNVAQAIVQQNKYKVE